jgi:hypothetical protein
MVFGDHDAEGFLGSLALGQTARDPVDDDDAPDDQDSRHVEQ